MASTERVARFIPTRTSLVAISIGMVTAALAGCGSSPSRTDAGMTSELDAPFPPGTDARVTPGTDAYLAPGTDAPMSGSPDAFVPAGSVCENTCEYADDGECDDGGPDSITSICTFGSDCGDCGPRDPSSCVPDCEGATCGDNGCGGTCGECTAPATCMGGTCGVCEPDCEGLACGDDGCGGSCGECGSGASCDRGACRTPSCAGRVCGSDGAGGDCGPMDGACPDGQGCRDGACVACDCTGRSCGQATGCDMSCGDCPAGMELCDRLTGMCSATATPAGCNDTCRFSGDNECDDGRPGSYTSLCEAGTDCSDCGPM